MVFLFTGASAAGINADLLAAMGQYQQYQQSFQKQQQQAQQLQQQTQQLQQQTQQATQQQRMDLG